MNPGDTIEIVVPMLPKWACFFPRWAMRFIPEIKVLHHGVVQADGTCTLTKVK